MTRVWLMSDLHLAQEGSSRWRGFGGLADADVLVAAGDVEDGSVLGAVEFLHRTVARYGMPVVYVPGNHEFYRSSFVEGLEAARERAHEFPGVHLLDRGEVVLNGARFLGATLWTDYCYGVETARDIAENMAMAQVGMMDHRLVDYRRLPERERLTPDHLQREHLRSRAWLEKMLAQPFEGRTVVVTHHLPHEGSVHARFKESLLTPAFASDLSDVLRGPHAPDLWLHGHTHESCDYRVGRTRVVCNPQGYGDENRAFQPRLVLEV